MQKFVFAFQCVLVCSHHSQQLFCPEDVFLHLVSIVLHLGDQQGQAAGLVPAGWEEKSQTESQAQTRSLFTESQLSFSPSLSTIPNMLCNNKDHLHYQKYEREWKKESFFCVFVNHFIICHLHNACLSQSNAARQLKHFLTNIQVHLRNHKFI